MIKTGFNAHAVDVEELFKRNGFTLAPLRWADRDAYTGQLTLMDDEERDGKSTELYIDEGEHGMEYCVTVYDEDGRQLAFEAEDTLAEALADYERLTLEHRTNATRLVM